MFTNMKFKLISTLTLILGVFALFSEKVIFGNIISYGDAVAQGVFDSQMVIQYDTEIYDDKEIYSPMMSILSKYGTEKATSNPVKGFDKKVITRIFTVTEAFTSQASPTTINIKLASKDKNSIVDYHKLMFSFTPTGAGYTNEAIVTDKWPLVGSPAAVDDYYIQVRASDPSLKLGIASGISIPPTTTYCFTVGTMFPNIAEASSPVSMFPSAIYNYISHIKWGYAYGNLEARMNLYDKKGLRYQLDRDAQMVFKSLKEDDFLFSGAGYIKNITDSKETHSTQVSKQQGLIYGIKNGGSPAVKGYDTSTQTFEEAHEEWIWKLADPELGAIGEKRFCPCDQAYLKYWTDKKKDKPGIEISPNGAFGIPGVTKVYTGYGNLVLDCFVHPKISAWQRKLTGNDLSKPFVMATIPSMIKTYTLDPDELYTNIQAPSLTGKWAEYRWAGTNIVHNIDTPYFGILYPL